ncbi:MAG: flagellar hook-associated protein FlgK [Firmicutes bacterium]|nr:flagellar hook-associated protein FlgK [Bacillota bacterium]
MISTFSSLEIGRTALFVTRQALDVAGHNIANVETPGYSRQRLTPEAWAPYGVTKMADPVSQRGMGVTAGQVQRLRTAFLDDQYQKEASSLSNWETRRDTLEQLEVIINEPSESGLRSVLDQFWNSLQELANNPESLAVRSLVRERGLVVADTFRHLDRQLKDLTQDLDTNIRSQVRELNAQVEAVAGLDRQIANIEALGNKANDLRDQRQILLEKLSRLAGVRVKEMPGGMVRITLGGKTLLDGETVIPIKVEDDPTNANQARLLWGETGVPVEISGGSLGSYFELRDKVVPGYLANVNQLASTLRDSLNAVHRGGYGLDGSTGLDFFSGTAGASDLALAPEVAADPNKMAASSSGLAGDGSNALALAQVKVTQVDDAWRSVIGILGVQSGEATRMAENQALLVNQIDRQRQSVSGVSLDEEMTSLIRYQQAYAAAARFITVADEMVDTIINRLGLAGR